MHTLLDCPLLLTVSRLPMTFECACLFDAEVGRACKVSALYPLLAPAVREEDDGLEFVMTSAHEPMAPLLDLQARSKGVESASQVVILTGNPSKDIVLSRLGRQQWYANVCPGTRNRAQLSFSVKSVKSASARPATDIVNLRRGVSGVDRNLASKHASRHAFS